MSAPGFWDNQDAAAKVSADHSRIARRLEEFRSDPGAGFRRVVEALPDGPDMSAAEPASKLIGKFDVPKDSKLFEKYFRRFPVLFNPEDLLR